MQHTVAVLEQIYTDVKFPATKKITKKLKASPKDLGMSRADLWAFAGLVALDSMQAETKKLCNEKSFAAMCGDNSTSCYAPFPNESKLMFKTGRIGNNWMIVNKFFQLQLLVSNFRLQP